MKTIFFAFRYICNFVCSFNDVCKNIWFFWWSCFHGGAELGCFVLIQKWNGKIKYQIKNIFCRRFNLKSTFEDNKIKQSREKSINKVQNQVLKLKLSDLCSSIYVKHFDVFRKSWKKEEESYNYGQNIWDKL